ncbi:hypothetical protein [Bacillus sp. GB_SG_008]|uniref:hypothetical protein n=1 Tax=Bacillus sp. GB_SG_008 TaxID=3454627 RepID=UPI003F85D088
MTLSQKVIKKCLLPFVLLCSLVLSIILPSQSALAGTLGPGFGKATYGGTFYSFVTEDGEYDGASWVPNTGQNIMIRLVDLHSINKNSGYKTPIYSNPSMLQVRLCSKSTGNCTVYKPFYWGSFKGTSGYFASFTNMKAGNYQIDIIDSWSSYRFSGELHETYY